MGLSSSKSTTKQQSTTTPTNPPWVTDAIKGQTDRINEFMARDPQSLVAGPSELQQKAFAGVDNLGGWERGLNQASNMAQRAGGAGANLAEAQGYAAPRLGPAGQAQSESLLDNLQLYMNPFLNDVVNASLDQYDADVGHRRAEMTAANAARKPFGDARYGFTEGAFEAQSARDRAGLDSGLRFNALDSAMQFSGADADRRQGANLFNTDAENRFELSQAGLDADAAQFGANARNQASMFNAQQQEAALSRQLQAAGLSADIANAVAANSRADLGLTAELGNIQQQIAQAQAYAPAQQLLIGTQALSGQPLNLFTGQTSSGTSTTKSSPGLLNAALGIGSLFAPIKIPGIS